MYIASAQALACKNEVGEVKATKNGVAIEYINQNDQSKRYVLDNDGLPTLAVATSYCIPNDRFLKISIASSMEDRACFDSAQSKLSVEDRLLLDNEGRIYAASISEEQPAIKLVRENCKIDIENRVQLARQVMDKRKVNCVSDVKELVDRAVQRSANYTAEMIESKKLAKLNLPKSEHKNFKKSLKDSHENVKKFAKLFEREKFTVEDLKKSAVYLKKAFQQREYNVLMNPDHDPTPENSVDYESALAFLGLDKINLKTNTLVNRGLASVKCKPSRVSYKILSKFMSNAKWPSKKSVRKDGAR